MAVTLRVMKPRSGGAELRVDAPLELHARGATDRRGGAIANRPILPGDLAATVLHHLGIDPATHWTNPAGRPMPLVEEGKVIEELG